MTTRTDATGKPQNGQTEADTIADVIEGGAANARETAQAAVEKGREALYYGREAVTELGDSVQAYVSRNAERAYRSARDAADLAGKGTTAFVRERPLSALVLAAGVGLLGGLLLNRRRH